MRPLTRGALACALASALAAPLPARADAELLLDLCINRRCVGVAAVVERGAEVLVDREALRAAGLDVDHLPAERVGERDYVPLRALNHGSTFHVDHAQLRLDLSLRPELLPRQQADLHDAARGETVAPAWSAFVNYAATLGQERRHALFLDGAAGRGHGALRTTAAWDRVLGWRRGMSRLEFDQPARLRRWTLGDQYAIASDALGGGLVLGGVGVERAFEQDPYLVTFPQPFYSGVLDTPGTVEVYSNGVLIGRRELVAGPFTLEHLGIPPGRSDVQVVVRDPFGNRSDLAAGHYYGASRRMLARGLDEYAVRLGAPRATTLGGGYESATALQAWYRRGLSDAITLGGRVEADDTLQNVGLDATWRLPVGEASLAVAASDTDGGGNGQAFAATWSYVARHWSLALGSRRAGAGYRNLGDPLAAIAGPLRLDEYAAVGFSPRGALSLQFNVGRQRRGDAPTGRNAGVTGTVQLWPRAQLLFRVQRREDALGRDTSALLSLSIALDRESLGLSARRSDGPDGRRFGTGLDLRRSRPVGQGWGYDLSLQRDDGDDFGFGQFEYQGAHGRYALQAERFGEETRASAVASGALVAMGGRVFATPPLESGFALVRVPGLAGVPILRHNLEVGRTDAHGDLLVPNLIPFYANRLALDEAAVPPGYTTAVPRRDVRVPRNTGALVTLEATPVRGVTGRFLGTDGGAPAGDRAWLQRGGARVAVPLGASGRFYFDGLAPGSHEIEVDGAAGEARCRIDVPANAAPGIADLGDVACQASITEAAP